MNAQAHNHSQSNLPNQSTEYELLAPDGSRIRGTLERIEAVKGIFKVKPDPNHGFSFEPDFERTELLWDSQTTARNSEDENLFIDDNGNTWPASELKIRPTDGES